MAVIKPLKMQLEQDTLAILDNSEVVNLYCIRLSDGMAVIEREYTDENGNLKYKFEIVEPTRISRIQHRDKISLKEVEKFVKECGII